MSDANLRQIRVLHIVSAGALASSLQQSLFMPLLTRLPRARVKSLVACLSPGAVPSAVLRQSGVPTYDLEISRKRFSPQALQELQQATRNFRPDVIQAWGHTAQVISAFLRPRCDWKPQLVWNFADTTPLTKNAGLIDRQKLKYAAKFATRADRIVYSSEAAAAAHKRVGFPEGEHDTIAPGVDATRFKPDFAARRKLREQLNLPGETFVVGMYAPFQTEYDFSTLIRAVGELIKINPNVALVLAGHGVQKGNAPLMALIGGGALSTRVHLLGEWSDISALYNACDVVCSSALNDQSRMNLVMAMLCGVPCVGTGMGAQGEVIGQHGVAIEPGNPSAFVKGITRVMQMTPEKRTFMAQGARKHALENYVYVRSLQKYLQLYYDSIGRQSLGTQDLPTPEVDATLTVPPALPTEAELNAAKRKPPKVADWGDPDSLESKVAEREPEELPKWRIEQEQERNKREAEVAAKVAATKSSGDVLQVFETRNASAQAAATPMTERARGVADDVEELLSPDELTAEVPILPRVSNAPSGARKSSNPSRSASPAAQPDAAKEAALKAARLAALQPIAPSPPRVATVKPAAAAKAAPAVAPVPDQSIDFLTTQPVLLAASELLQTAPAPAKAGKTNTGATQRVETLKAPAALAAQVESRAKKVNTGATQRAETLKAPAVPTQVEMRAKKVDTGSTPSLSVESKDERTAPVQAVAASAQAPSPAAEIESSARRRLGVFAEGEGTSKAQTPAASAPASLSAEQIGSSTTQPDSELFASRSASTPVRAEQVDNGATQRVDALAASAIKKIDSGTTQPSIKLDDVTARFAAVPATDVSRSQSLAAAASAPEKVANSSTQPKSEPAASPLGRLAKALASASVPPAPAASVASPAATSARVESKPSFGNMQRPSPAAATGATQRMLAPKIGTKAGASQSAKADEKASAGATASMTAALEKWNSSFNLGELSLMATGMWAAAPRTDASTKREGDEAKSDELSGAEALSLISELPAEETASSTDPTLKLETLPEPATEAKLAANE